MTPRLYRNRRRLSAALTGLGLIGAQLSIIGCSSDSTAPEVSPESYRGPSISLDSAGEFHTILVQSPSPGYVVLVERVEENRGFDEAFVTIRMPNPRFSFPQTAVEQRALTSVHSSRPLRVNARLMGFDEISTAYHPAVAEVRPQESPR